MVPKFPVDYLIIGVCLDLRLASLAQLSELVRLQAETAQDTPLDEFLVGAGILSRPMRDQIYQALHSVRDLRGTQLADSAGYISLEGFPPPGRIDSSSSTADVSEAITLTEEGPTIEVNGPSLPSTAFDLPPKEKYQLVQNRLVAGLNEGQPSSQPAPQAAPIPSSAPLVVPAGLSAPPTLSNFQAVSTPAKAGDFVPTGFGVATVLSTTPGILGETLRFSSLVRQAGTTGIRLDLDRAKGSILAGHRMERKLGSGGMGEVYLATQLSLKRPVAIKVLPPDTSTNQRFIQRFVDEARTLATFTHPNIVQVYDVGVEDGIYWFSMEAVPGQTLSDLLKKDGKIPVPQAVNMTKQILRGLDRAARAGIIHRDIKPANILVDNQGLVKVVDFGLAVHQDKLEQLGQSVAGTPYYISPEQSRGETVSSASDMYSLGATLYHMLTGRPPFVGRNIRELLERHQHTLPEDPCITHPEIPVPLGHIVLRMLAKKPEDRYPSFQSLFRQLEDFELREGLTETRSSFLAEGLINIGEQSVRKLQTSIALMMAASAGFTAAAIGGGALLDAWNFPKIKDMAGNLGALLLFLALAVILHIASVRKGYLKRVGSIRIWLQVHIVLALVGYFLSMVHSGNFFGFILEPPHTILPDGTRVDNDIPLLPFLNSLLFTIVVTSGLVGRYIWRDLAKQVTAQRIARGLPTEEATRETHELTLAIFAQRGLRYWRAIHYPMAMALVVLTIAHIFTILFYTGW